ncbi:hypothetical protein CYLTODRAFT_447771 [Cylindrobasidium torrendii FP15055 ss-10]|uniref:Uncharacterized protein n=1 Tax=Cylindrobasidium torrendii FP15055 ss-10 TaxID=1314674 RepID=A0A0D7ASD6_9AGAR|nr:hypothetical protein CYLTODRAFT_447771 [Cylindrobasidium torrendii FP15055 ss-10]
MAPSSSLRATRSTAPSSTSPAYIALYIVSILGCFYVAGVVLYYSTVIYRNGTRRQRELWAPLGDEDDRKVADNVAKQDQEIRDMVKDLSIAPHKYELYTERTLRWKFFRAAGTFPGRRRNPFEKPRQALLRPSPLRTITFPPSPSTVDHDLQLKSSFALRPIHVRAFSDGKAKSKTLVKRTKAIRHSKAAKPRPGKENQIAVF